MSFLATVVKNYQPSTCRTNTPAHKSPHQSRRGLTRRRGRVDHRGMVRDQPDQSLAEPSYQQAEPMTQEPLVQTSSPAKAGRRDSKTLHVVMRRHSMLKKRKHEVTLELDVIV
eukprot:4059596-Amphidinium_carterae.1